MQAQDDLSLTSHPKLMAGLVRATLQTGPEVASAERLGDSPWRLVEAGGYWVIFRFASRAEIAGGKETKALRYVARVVEKHVLLDADKFPDGLAQGFLDDLRKQAGEDPD